MKKIIITATSLNNVIGNNGVLPWHNTEELKHFKETTLNHAVLMGRKTYESIGKTLHERVNLVLSRKTKENDKEKNLFYFSSIDNAIEYAEKTDEVKLFIIGGSEIYFEAINIADELLISRMPFETEGDKYFPKIDSNIWELIKSKKHNSFTVERYIRKKLFR